jgi:hypothetical protein
MSDAPEIEAEYDRVLALHDALQAVLTPQQWQTFGGIPDKPAASERPKQPKNLSRKRTDELGQLLFDMEDDVHSVVHLTRSLMMLGGADSMPRDEGDAVVRVAIAALDKATAVENVWRKLFQLKHGADAV